MAFINEEGYTDIKNDVTATYTGQVFTDTLFVNCTLTLVECNFIDCAFVTTSIPRATNCKFDGCDYDELTTVGRDIDCKFEGAQPKRLRSINTNTASNTGGGAYFEKDSTFNATGGVNVLGGHHGNINYVDNRNK